MLPGMWRARTDRSDPLLPNALIVARREFVERIRSRLFHSSTFLLAGLAVLVAFTPFFAKVIDRGTTTRIAIVASDDTLAERAIGIMGAVLNSEGVGSGQVRPWDFVRAVDRQHALQDVAESRMDAALVTELASNGRLDFTFFTGEGVAADRTQLVSIGTLAVAILDWTAVNKPDGLAFQMPSLEVIAAAGPSAGGLPISSAEYGSRRILGVVFVVLIFLVVVIYGMWVAAGVVAEKTSRIVELIVSAASARQLLVGKVAGIGAAALVQAVSVLVPALLALVVEDRVSVALLGPEASIAPSLSALSAPLLAIYLAFFVSAFVLYALVYAAAGSLVSRPEDLQVMALPLSLIGIAGYLQAVLALTGGSPGFIRVASYVPFWSPFVMTTRLVVGHVEPWELALSLALLLATIGVALVVAPRVYAAGVLLYGQRPGVRDLGRAVLRQT